MIEGTRVPAVRAGPPNRPRRATGAAITTRHTETT